MRELRFRAWDQRNKKMYFMDNCDFIIERDGVSKFSEFSNDRINTSWELEQYTGLKDRTGTEIYENDIVISSNDGQDGCDEWSSDEVGSATVKMSTTDGVTFVKNNDRWGYIWTWEQKDSIYSLRYIEIIGNRHETI